jgi:ubiquinone biosynthesis accessory factor UbiK
MFKPEKLEEAIQQFTRLLPTDMQQARQDIEKNMKAALTASLARMDLVTREEFEVQSELLAKTRVLLQDLETRLASLEAERENRKTD